MPNKKQKQKSDLQVAFLFYIDLYLQAVGGKKFWLELLMPTSSEYYKD